MTTLKSHIASLLGLLILAFLLGPGSSQPCLAQGMPVFDAANVAQSISMVRQAESQLAQQIATLKTLLGPRGLGQILDNPSLYQTLPSNWGSTYSALDQGNLSALSPAAAQIRSSNLIMPCPSDSSVAAGLCRRNAAMAPQQQAYTLGMTQNGDVRLDQIHALMGQIDSTPDAKASADLNARLIAEVAAIQNEANRIALYQTYARTESALIAQQHRELDTQRAARTQTTAQTLSPVVFQ